MAKSAENSMVFWPTFLETVGLEFATGVARHSFWYAILVLLANR
jgi:hypothetical protein